METNHIPFEDLPITNRFMFALVFSHKHIAKPFLEALLGIKIFDLQEPEPEKSTENSPFSKGVRYDVFVKEREPKGEILRVFDIEMQIEDTHELPKRTRYYQALCDSEALNKGNPTATTKNSTSYSFAPTTFSSRDVQFTGSRTLKSDTQNMNWAIYASRIFIYSMSTRMSPRNPSRNTLNTLQPTRRPHRKQRTSNASGNGICRTMKQGSAI
ncbi:MAG: PD-(D/E)XK nuclease family transposase [Fibrobacter sp.]|nr:PD-(D/E)XK nuclease family transposase [Fibrobacter sp.]